jgi:hypothetical protein
MTKSVMHAQVVTGLVRLAIRLFSREGMAEPLVECLHWVLPPHLPQDIAVRFTSILGSGERHKYPILIYLYSILGSGERHQYPILWFFSLGSIRTAVAALFGSQVVANAPVAPQAISAVGCLTFSSCWRRGGGESEGGRRCRQVAADSLTRQLSNRLLTD